MSKITRTLKSSTAEVIFFDVETEKLVNVKQTFRGELDAKEVMKLCGNISGAIPCKVKSITVSETLYGMDEDLFISLSKPVDKRSPETRGTITKEVGSFMASVMMFNLETMTAETVSRQIPRKMDDKAALAWISKHEKSETLKPVKVEKIEEVKGLRYLTVDDFIKNAEIMPPRPVNSESAD